MGPWGYFLPPPATALSLNSWSECRLDHTPPSRCCAGSDGRAMFSGFRCFGQNLCRGSLMPTSVLDPEDRNESDPLDRRYASGKRT